MPDVPSWAGLLNITDADYHTIMASIPGRSQATADGSLRTATRSNATPDFVTLRIPQDGEAPPPPYTELPESSTAPAAPARVYHSRPNGEYRWDGGPTTGLPQPSYARTDDCDWGLTGTQSDAQYHPRARPGFGSTSRSTLEGRFMAHSLSTMGPISTGASSGQYEANPARMSYVPMASVGAGSIGMGATAALMRDEANATARGERMTAVRENAVEIVASTALEATGESGCCEVCCEACCQCCCGVLTGICGS